MSKQLHNRTSPQELQAASDFLREMGKALRMALGQDNGPLTMSREMAARLMAECDDHAAALALRPY